MSAEGGAPGAVLAGGLPLEDATGLAERLGLPVYPVQRGDEVLNELRRGGWSALVLDDRLVPPRGIALLDRVRDDPAGAFLPIVYCLGLPVAADLQSALVDRFAVEQILYAPLDRDELGRYLARFLGVPYLDGAADAPGTTRRVADALAGLWRRYRGENLDRVATVDRAVQALTEGRLDDAGRREAERAAHKLAGALGTFGFCAAGETARAIEQMLGEPSFGAPHLQPVSERLDQERNETTSSFHSAPGPTFRTPTVNRGRLLQLVEQVAAIKRDLAGETVEDVGAEPDRRALLLVVDADPDRAERLATEARRRALRPEVVASALDAAALLARDRPDVVLLDLSTSGEVADGLALLSRLGERNPPIPALVTTDQDGLVDRVTAAQAGARGFLPRPLGAVQTLDAVGQLLVRLRATQSTILAVDDDPSIHAALHALLDPRGLRLATLNDPLRFWEALETTAPDLLILDVDMPHLSGVELCRVVRNDARWSSLPVLFLSARNDSETIHRLFSAGADDYVRKPIVGPELLTRILNRLERTRLLRSLAETDALSGVANRWKSSQMIEQYLRLADRYRQAVALAVLDLDHFKAVNDRYGHDAGDEVVRRLGCVLRSSFRSEDVVGRWGGEEFVVGMYGMSRRDGIRRLAQVLESLRRESFAAPSGDAFSVTFSAGIAQYPEDGRDLPTLYRRADEALYRAKHDGRARVAAAEGVGVRVGE